MRIKQVSFRWRERRPGRRRSCERREKHPTVGLGQTGRALLTKLISSWDFTVHTVGVGVGCCRQALWFQVLSPPLVGREPCCDLDHQGFLPLTVSLDHTEGVRCWREEVGSCFLTPLVGLFPFNPASFLPPRIIKSQMAPGVRTLLLLWWEHILSAPNSLVSPHRARS